MATTILRLSDELKARIAKLAEKSGRTPHEVMLDAIAQKVEKEELRASLHSEADSRFAAMMESGAGISLHDMRAYLKTRATGKKAQAPKVRQWRK